MRKSRSNLSFIEAMVSWLARHLQIEGTHKGPRKMRKWWREWVLWEGPIVHNCHIMSPISWIVIRLRHRDSSRRYGHRKNPEDNKHSAIWLYMILTREEKTAGQYEQLLVYQCWLSPECHRDLQWNISVCAQWLYRVHHKGAAVVFWPHQHEWKQTGTTWDEDQLANAYAFSVCLWAATHAYGASIEQHKNKVPVHQ